MGRGHILTSQHDGYAILKLENPAARNAMSSSMMASLPSTVANLVSKKTPIVIVTGDSKAFCAGGDLKDVRHSLIDPDRARDMNHHMTKALNQLQNSPVYLMAAVEGAALGGGAELLTAMDYIVASRSAKIGFVHARLGVSPGWGGAKRLIDKIGKRKALNVMLDAQIHSVGYWKDIGFVDEVVNKDDSLSVAIARAESILSHGVDVVSGMLNIVKGPQAESDVFLSLWGSSTHRKALGLNK